MRIAWTVEDLTDPLLQFVGAEGAHGFNDLPFAVALVQNQRTCLGFDIEHSLIG
jgi:hypothetical protein